MAASIVGLVGGGIVLVVGGVRFTRLADRLADRTGLGEAVVGAVLVGATTSLPGIVTTVTGAVEGAASFAVSNAVGSIAVQTVFLAVADLIYRDANLEHAAASLPNLMQTMVLLALLGLVLVGVTGPDVTVLGVSPVTVVLPGAYLFGIVLTRRAEEAPQWRPRQTPATRTDVPDGAAQRESLARLWGGFGAYALVVGGTGWLIARAGLSITERTGLSGALVGALLTGVVTSAPELVTVLSAVRIGALTLAVADIIGGNTFDVLNVAIADVFFREGSVYHAVDDQTVYVLALTIVLTAVLAAGLIERDRRGIGFEGVGILALYALGVAGLVAMG